MSSTAKSSKKKKKDGGGGAPQKATKEEKKVRVVSKSPKKQPSKNREEGKKATSATGAAAPDRGGSSVEVGKTGTSASRAKSKSPGRGLAPANPKGPGGAKKNSKKKSVGGFDIYGRPIPSDDDSDGKSVASAVTAASSPAPPEDIGARLLSGVYAKAREWIIENDYSGNPSDKEIPAFRQLYFVDRFHNFAIEWLNIHPPFNKEFDRDAFFRSNPDVDAILTGLWIKYRIPILLVPPTVVFMLGRDTARALDMYLTSLAEDSNDAESSRLDPLFDGLRPTQKILFALVVFMFKPPRASSPIRRTFVAALAEWMTHEKRMDAMKTAVIERVGPPRPRRPNDRQSFSVVLSETLSVYGRTDLFSAIELLRWARVAYGVNAIIPSLDRDASREEAMRIVGVPFTDDVTREDVSVVDAPYPDRNDLRRDARAMIWFPAIAQCALYAIAFMPHAVATGDDPPVLTSLLYEPNLIAGLSVVGMEAKIADGAQHKLGSNTPYERRHQILISFAVYMASFEASKKKIGGAHPDDLDRLLELTDQELESESMATDRSGFYRYVFGGTVPPELMLYDPREIPLKPTSLHGVNVALDLYRRQMHAGHKDIIRLCATDAKGLAELKNDETKRKELANEFYENQQKAATEALEGNARAYRATVAAMEAEDRERAGRAALLLEDEKAAEEPRLSEQFVAAGLEAAAAARAAFAAHEAEERRKASETPNPPSLAQRAVAAVSSSAAAVMNQMKSAMSALGSAAPVSAAPPTTTAAASSPFVATPAADVKTASAQIVELKGDPDALKKWFGPNTRSERAFVAAKELKENPNAAELAKRGLALKSTENATAPQSVAILRGFLEAALKVAISYKNKDLPNFGMLYWVLMRQQFLSQMYSLFPKKGGYQFKGASPKTVQRTVKSFLVVAYLAVLFDRENKWNAEIEGLLTEAFQALESVIGAHE